MLPPPDIWDGGWHAPQDHASRIEDVFCDDATADAETDRKRTARPAGFTTTRGTHEPGVTER